MYPTRAGLRLSTFVLACLFAGLGHAQNAIDLNAKGFELYNMRQWPEAVASFEAAYTRAPDNMTIRRNLSNAYQALADALAQQKNIKDAIEYVIQAIGVDTENPLPLIQLGSYYVREGQINEAIFRLEEAIELDGKSVDAHFLLGEAYFKDNDASSALDQWEWVRKVEPDRPSLRERMDSAYRQERVEFEFQGLESTHFSITYNKDVRWANAKSVLQILETAYRNVGRDLGGTYPPAPIQVTLYSPEGFSETTQMGDHIGALYDGVKIRVSMLDNTGKHIDHEELRRKLIHEYVHVVVRSLAKDNVPWWLNEGLAEVISRDLSDVQFDYLRRAKQEDLLFSLSELTPGQLDRLDVDALKLAYRQSHATVAYLKKRFGLRKLAHMLKDMGSGTPSETALSYSCHLNFTTLEKAASAFIERG